MADDRSIESHEVGGAEFVLGQRWVRREESEEGQVGSAARYSYEMKMGRQTIRLDPIAFRILNVLAARPYQAYTRRRLAEAASTPRQSVTEASIDAHVTRLREALGFFGDYVQTVPYIGYRFKA